MSTYAGQDPIPSPPVTAGAGTWPDLITIPDDGDPRAAASVNVALEALADRTQWLAEHQVNGVDGGGPYLGPIIMLDLTVGPDGVLTVNGSAGHVAQVICDTYSTTTFRTGAGVTCNSGSIFTVGAGCIVTATIGGGGAAGSLTIGADGDVVHASGSTDTYQSGSSLTTNTGAIVNLNIGKTNAGTVTNGALAVEVHESSSTDTYQSGSTLNHDGTITRTGKETLSGVGAYTELRIRNAADADDVNVNGKAADIVSISLVSGFSRTFVLDDAAVGKVYSFKIKVSAAAAEFLNVNSSAGLVYSIAPGAGKSQTVEFFWTGGAWTTGIVGMPV
jgi:hypothetical protein